MLSNFEAGSNYQDTQDPAVTVLFKVNDDDTYLAAWTTTPWTLPSNLGLCVGPDIDYVKVFDESIGAHVILAEARLSAYETDKTLTPVEQMKGSTLAGLKYEPLFPYFAEQEDLGAFQVLVDDYVTTEAGTGIVHQAPAFGEDDFRVFKAAGLPRWRAPLTWQVSSSRLSPILRGFMLKKLIGRSSATSKTKGLLQTRGHPAQLSVLPAIRHPHHLSDHRLLVCES